MVRPFYRQRGFPEKFKRPIVLYYTNTQSGLTAKPPKTESEDTMGLKKIKKFTVSDSIITQMQEMILNGSYKPGQRLPSERELAELLSVSRPSVREAMRSLQTLGIIEIRSGEGTFLNDNVSILADHFKMNYLLKKYSILELIEARKILEVEIAAIAAKKATPENKEMLEDIHSEIFKTQGDLEAFLKCDFSFHLAVAETSQNSVLREMLNTTRDLLLEANVDVIKKPGQIETAIRSHGNILKAILDGDVDRAKKEMLYHLETIEVAINEIYYENLLEKERGG